MLDKELSIAYPTRRRPPRRRSPLGRHCSLIGALAGIVALAGCGGLSAGGSSNELVLYSAQHPETTSAIVAAFTKQTGIKVVVKNGAEDVLTAQLDQEGSRSPADVVYTENSNWLEQLGDRGRLAKVTSATLAGVPHRDSATNGDWLGVSGRFSALIYNPGKVTPSQLPKSAMALADPKYRGMLELAPAETDFWPIISSVARSRGQEAALQWLKGLRANAGSNDNAPDNETVVSDISKGVADMGLINHYYFFRIRSEMGSGSFHARLAWFASGDPGYVEDISGAGILESSSRKPAAQKFLAFLVSPTGQRVLAQSSSYEYPLVKGVAANAALPPLSMFKPSPITPAQIGTGLDARNLLREAGLI